MKIESCLALNQIPKLSSRILSRQQVANKLTEALQDIDGISLPAVRSGCTHGYYIYGIIVQWHMFGGSDILLRDFAQKHDADWLIIGYQNVHKLPIFRDKLGYGTSNFPWSLVKDASRLDKPLVRTESVNSNFIGILTCKYQYDDYDIMAIRDFFVALPKSFSQMNIAIIPARSGSKRIPGKNTKLFLDKPMLAYPIMAAQASRLFDHIYVSTDHQTVADTALSLGASVPFLRDPRLADDHTPTVPRHKRFYQKLTL